MTVNEASRVGVEAAGAYFGSAVIDVDAIFAGRRLDASRSGNLMMLRKSVALPAEDIVSFAVNAAWPIISKLPSSERETIRTLIVATESGVDFSKSAGTYVHDLLGMPRGCRLFEVKQACYAGTAALRAAAALVAAEGGRALVIAGDLPVPMRGTYAEPSQGAGAVALLVGEPRLARLHLDICGLCSYETTDFSRPQADLDLVDVDLSLFSYLECLQGAFDDYARRGAGVDFVASFDALAMHTPFPGMVKGAHRTVIRRGGWLAPDKIEADFIHRVAPSLRYPREVGNIYSASTLLALLSSLRHGVDRGRRVGVFSYGGGCASEFFSCDAAPDASRVLRGSGIDDALRARRRLTLTEYDALVDAMPTIGFGVRDAQVDLTRHKDVLETASGDRPLVFLSAIDGFHREYTWVKGGALCDFEAIL